MDAAPAGAVPGNATAVPAARVARSPALRRLLRHRLAMVGLVSLVLLVLACVVGPFLVPYGPLTIDLRHRFQPPFAGPHWLGSDPLGRDQLIRLLLAGRISLTVGFAAMALSTATGVLVGLAAGFYGGWTGTALMRLVDAMLCFPSIFLLLTSPSR